MSVKLKYLANDGIYLQFPEGGIAIDAVFTEAQSPYSNMPSEIVEALLNRRGDFQDLRGFLFTHSHKDHCDLRLVENMLDTNLPVVIPDESLVRRLVPAKALEKKNLILLDSEERVWETEFLRITSIPTVHDRYHEERNHCYLLEFLKENCSVLVLGDTETGEDYFPSWLAEKKIDLVCVNFPELHQEKGRNFLSEFVKADTILLSHMPFEEDDRFHYRRPLKRQMTRYQDLFPGLWLPEKSGDSILIG